MTESSEQVPVTTKASTEDHSPQKSTGKRAGLVVILFLLLAVIAAGAYFGTHPDDRHTESCG